MKSRASALGSLPSPSGRRGGGEGEGGERHALFDDRISKNSRNPVNPVFDPVNPVYFLFFKGLRELVWVIFDHFQRTGNMHVSILSRRYSSSRSPYARRWMTRILLLSPSTKPSDTLFSGLQ